MKTLIGISGWHGGQAQINAQRATWGRDVEGTDLVFFKGRPHPFILGGPQPDEVWLDCPDTYPERKLKIIAMMRWALEHDYDYLWNVGDDVYLRPERLLALLPYDYCGAVTSIPSAPSTNFFAAFSQLTQRAPSACIGWAYGLSKRSMVVLLESEERGYSNHEDIWVGQKLFDNRVTPVHLDGLIKKTHTHGVPNGWHNQMAPRGDNRVILSCEYTPEQMFQVDKEFKECRR
jgi:hypothetical protein